MSRGWQGAIAILIASAAFGAQTSSDEACTRDAIPRVSQQPQSTTLFMLADREARIVQTTNGVLAPMAAPEVLMARIGPDGKLMIVCVDGEDSARKVLTTAVDDLPRIKVK
jgi:hypothetical protein